MTEEKDQVKPLPAWKLREMNKGKGLDTPLKRNSAHNAAQKLRRKNRMQTVDPNLPPAFKAVMSQRLAFAKQQARRKNKDEFVSLNSSHPEGSAHYADDDSFSDDDSFGADDLDDFDLEEEDEENAEESN